MSKVDIIMAPGLVSDTPMGKTAVLIDVVRFTTSMTAALNNGAQCVETFDNIETPIKLKQEGWLAAGERNGIKPEEFNFGNSPLEFTADKVKDKKIAFSTTNGTYTRSKLKNYENIYAGGFVNISALEQRLTSENKDVVLVCSGRFKQPAIEDTLFAGALAKRLTSNQGFDYKSDSVFMAINLYDAAKNNVKEFAINNSPFLNWAYKDFITKDLDFVFNNDVFNCVPEEICACKFVIKR